MLPCLNNHSKYVNLSAVKKISQENLANRQLDLEEKNLPLLLKSITEIYQRHSVQDPTAREIIRMTGNTRPQMDCFHSLKCYFRLPPQVDERPIEDVEAEECQREHYSGSLVYPLGDLVRRHGCPGNVGR